MTVTGVGEALLGGGGSISVRRAWGPRTMISVAENLGSVEVGGVAEMNSHSVAIITQQLFPPTPNACSNNRLFGPEISTSFLLPPATLASMNTVPAAVAVASVKSHVPNRPDGGWAPDFSAQGGALAGSRSIH